MKTLGAFVAALLIAGVVFYGLDYALFSLQGAPLPFEGGATGGGGGGH